MTLADPRQEEELAARLTENWPKLATIYIYIYIYIWKPSSSSNF